jgi:glycosyltransferase involved in cell wall biosynthesis
MRLVNLPAPRRRAIETLGHTFISAVHASRLGLDCVVLFNAANAPLLPLLRMPVAVHLDGLEWKRGKWAGRGQQYLRWAERRAVLHADRVVADARAIQKYVSDTYGAGSEFIPYGALLLGEDTDSSNLPAGLKPRQYHLVVARFEPENSVEMILRAYLASDAKLPLLLVGDAPYESSYRTTCIGLASSSADVLNVGAVWDQAVLDACYAHCLTYLHGHTVGGTNPSLLRAMGAGACVVARDVVFNREVAGPDARFFSSDAELGRHIVELEAAPLVAAGEGGRLRKRAASAYRWDAVAQSYEQLCADLCSGGVRP